MQWRVNLAMIIIASVKQELKIKRLQLLTHARSPSPPTHTQAQTGTQAHTFTHIHNTHTHAHVHTHAQAHAHREATSFVCFARRLAVLTRSQQFAPFAIIFALSRNKCDYRITSNHFFCLG